MKIKCTYYTLIMLFPILLCCRMENKNETRQQNDTAIKTDDRDFEQTTTDDLSEDNSLNDHLLTIRKTVSHINSIEDWSSIVMKELSESTEGGKAKYYLFDGKLQKIISQHFGETFQLLTQYYIHDDKLCFVIEQRTNYNRPIYYDQEMMKENDDREAFDIDKSEIIEHRSYFENNRLLHQINNKDSTTNLSQEQNRIQNNFNKLLKMINH